VLLKKPRSQRMRHAELSDLLLLRRREGFLDIAVTVAYELERSLYKHVASPTTNALPTGRIHVGRTRFHSDCTALMATKSSW
jgi:hypothetical protein